MNRVPKLRFKEFSGEWEEKIFKNIFKINQGLQIAISERFLEPSTNRMFYITNEFLRKDSKIKYYIENPPENVICNKEDILMTRTGNTGEVVTDIDGAFHNNFFKINFNKNNFNKKFICYVLKSTKIQNIILKFAGTSTIPDLNHSDFYKIKSNFPYLEEQQKIADFLSSVDKKISIIEEKLDLFKDYKKGIMQKIFNQELRFRDTEGNYYPEWKKLNAEEIFKNVSNKNHNGDLPILAVTQDKGVVYRDSLDLKIDSSETGIKNYKIIESGDFVISLRSFQGGIEYSTIFGISSPAYTVLKPKIEISDFFYKFYLKKESFISELNSTIEGIRDGKQISYTMFSKLKLPYPKVEEQQKIADFLSSIDNKIDNLTNELKNLKEFKKGLLQQMFI